jgi:O-antigen ligase
MNQLRFSKFLEKCLPPVYVAFFLSLFCGFRVMSSTCEGVLLGLTLLLAFLNKGSSFKNRNRNDFVVGCLIFYLLQLAALAYTHDLASGMQQIQVKLTLLFIPVSLYYNNYLNSSFRDKVMPFYVLLMALAILYCLGAATRNYSANHDNSVFFYHTLVKPFGHNAIQFSIFVFIGLVYLLESLKKQSFFLNKPFLYFAISFFIFFIILLSSKMVIIFSFISILFYILSIKNSGFFKGRLILSAITPILILLMIIATHNPVGSRFKDIFNGNINVVEKNQFNPGDYFNGLQFRLLQWKLVAEILHEHHAWILGVSPGDAQHLLDKKYLSLNMYVGDPDGKSHGFLGYNAHNEFLESTLQTGIVGLVAFIIICAGCIRMMKYCRSVEFWLIGTLLLSYCFLESVFQTQYGGLLFTFFPLLLYCTTEKVSGKESLVSRS